MPETPHEIYPLVVSFRVAVTGRKEIVGSGEGLIEDGDKWIHQGFGCLNCAFIKPALYLEELARLVCFGVVSQIAPIAVIACDVSSITIVELKRPQRDDLATEETDPITQVYDYVTDIKEGKVKKANGRGFGNIQQVAFYCYVIVDTTPSLKKSAARAGLVPTQDGDGYFGYNPTVGTYIEVISYDKLLKDAKQRNRALFDKLFEPKSKELKHPELIGE